MEIYHGSDHVVKEPKFGYGKPDNDYGSGFYCTEDEDKADDWAIANGKEKAICNKYELDLKGLNVLYLIDVVLWLGLPKFFITEVLELSCQNQWQTK